MSLILIAIDTRVDSGVDSGSDGDFEFDVAVVAVLLSLFFRQLNIEEFRAALRDLDIVARRADLMDLVSEMGTVSPFICIQQDNKSAQFGDFY